MRRGLAVAAANESARVTIMVDATWRAFEPEADSRPMHRPQQASDPAARIGRCVAAGRKLSAVPGALVGGARTLGRDSAAQEIGLRRGLSFGGDRR